MLSTPDITKAQLLAIVQAVLGFLVAFGVDLSAKQQDAVIQLCTALAVAIPIADAVIRNGRARGAAQKNPLS